MVGLFSVLSDDGQLEEAGAMSRGPEPMVRRRRSRKTALTGSLVGEHGDMPWRLTDQRARPAVTLSPTLIVSGEAL